MTTDRFAALRERYETLRRAHGLNFIMLLSADEFRELLDVADDGAELKRTFAEHAAAETMRVNEAWADRNRLNAELARQCRVLGDTLTETELLRDQRNELRVERDRLVAVFREIAEWPDGIATDNGIIKRIARAALAEYALERMAENARDLGLDY